MVYWSIIYFVVRKYLRFTPVPGPLGGIIFRGLIKLCFLPFLQKKVSSDKCNKCLCADAEPIKLHLFFQLNAWAQTCQRSCCSAYVYMWGSGLQWDLNCTQTRDVGHALQLCSPRLLSRQAKRSRCGWAQQPQNPYSPADNRRLVWILWVQTIVFSSTVNKTRKHMGSEVLWSMFYPRRVGVTFTYISCSVEELFFFPPIIFLRLLQE